MAVIRVSSSDSKITPIDINTDKYDLFEADGVPKGVPRRTVGKLPVEQLWDDLRDAVSEIAYAERNSARGRTGPELS